MSKEESVGKWDWIAKKCYALEYQSTGDVSKVLAFAEAEVFPNRTSWYWEAYRANIENMWSEVTNKANWLFVIATFPEFKIGCLKNGYRCEDCVFGIKYGKCGEEFSIEQYWVDVLELDCGADIEGKDVTLLQRQFAQMFGQCP